MNEKDKLEFLDISTIIAALTAVLGDIFSLSAAGGVIPLIGLPILFFAVFVHYLAGLMMGAFVFRKLAGLIPKIVLAIGIILPLPILFLSLLLAIIFQSKIVQTVAIAAIGAATGGAGAVAAKGVSAAAKVAEETEGAAAGVEGVGAARAVAGIEKGASAEEKAAKTGTSERPGSGRAGREVSPEELGEEPEPMERLQKRLLQETPSGGTAEEEQEDDEDGVYADGNEIDLRNS